MSKHTFKGTIKCTPRSVFTDISKRQVNKSRTLQLQAAQDELQKAKKASFNVEKLLGAIKTFVVYVLERLRQANPAVYYLGSISALPKACLLRGYGRAGYSK